MKKKKYLVIIGDILKSREIKNRTVFQQKFKKIINQLAHERFEYISPITLTLGDEFQAVLPNAANLFDIICRVDLKLSQVQIRYGIGIGTIDTEINRTAAISMDGSAFHFARKSLEAAKKQSKKAVFWYDDSPASGMEQLRANILFDWFFTIYNKWNSNMKTIFYNFKKKTQEDIAGQLGISQSAVSQFINKPTSQLAYNTQDILKHDLNRIIGYAKN